MIEVPRSLLSEFFRMPEAEQVGVYFLFAEDEQDGAPKAYIGQTATLRQRSSQPGQQQEYRNRALVPVSLTSSLTNTHASYLELLSNAPAPADARYLLASEEQTYELSYQQPTTDHV